MNDFKFTIIVPCFNVEKYIDECMKSILDQSFGYQNLQIILVDDASVDNTRDKLIYYEKMYPDNITVICCDKNGHQGTARNIGLEYAIGEYVSFVDADDVISLDMYKILDKIARETDSDMIKFIYTTKKSEIKIADNYNVDYYDLSDKELRRSLLFDQNILNESCTMKVYKRELLEKSDVRFAEGVSYEEPLFTYPLNFYANSISVSDIPLYYYRFNVDGTTVKHMKQIQSILEHMGVQLETYEFMKQTVFYDDFKDEIDLYFLQSFFVEGFYFLKNRGLFMPVEYFRFCVEKVLEEVPTYKENKYWENFAVSEIGVLFELLEGSYLMSNRELQKNIKEITGKLQMFSRDTVI